MTIPRTFHRLWPEVDPLPYRFRGYVDGFRQLHPDWDWEQKLWTPGELDELPMANRALYDRAEQEAPKDWIRWRADIARLEVLYREGGVYVDTDTEALKSFEPLLEDHGSCWWAESPNREGAVTQAVFAATPEHPFLAHLLARLADSAREYQDKKRIHYRVGTKFVDREFHALRESGQLEEWNVRMLPWRWFAGQSIKDREAGKDPDLSKAYSWHRYDNTQKHRSAKPQIAAFRAAADVLDAAGVTWFLCSGVLLGHVRDGAWIPWDTDVDLGIWPGDVERARKAFEDAGWPFKRNRESQMWPVHGKTKIDLHTHYRDGDSVYKLHGKGEKIRMDYPARLFEDMRPSVFYLRRCLIPSPPEDYLAHQYGPEWLTPQQDWKWDESPHNITRL